MPDTTPVSQRRPNYLARVGIVTGVIGILCAVAAHFVRPLAWQHLSGIGFTHLPHIPAPFLRYWVETYLASHDPLFAALLLLRSFVFTCSVLTIKIAHLVLQNRRSKLAARKTFSA